jgi:hypothetical protein
MREYSRTLSTTAAFAFASFALLAGCTTDLGTFPLLATKNVDLSNINTRAASTIPKVTGDDSATQFVYLGGMPSLKTATDHAEDKGDGVAIANAHIQVDSWNALVVNQYKFVVTGSPISK